MESKCDRRKFIRATSLGATSLALGVIAQSPRWAWGYVPRDEINPTISNLRVVYVYDNAMTNGTGPVSGWANQNAVTNDAVVAANMDKMACALAQRQDIADAWRTIFIKPAAKQWNQVVVAIKTNNIELQHTRNAVMKKICEVLVNHVGVLGTNIHIYDGHAGATMLTETPWQGLPSGVRVELNWGGINTWVNLPPPYGSGTNCVASIANGTVDVLINIAVCKYHYEHIYGGFTMCLKNHFGTFTPNHDTNYLFSINKSEALLGPMDAGTGRIITPRQQLCFIDALWASEGGPSGEPSVRPNRLFMGTFGPAVDYQVATKFRRDTMGWPIGAIITDRFLTEFGYSPIDLPNGGAMIDALTWGTNAVRYWEQYQ